RGTRTPRNCPRGRLPRDGNKVLPKRQRMSARKGDIMFYSCLSVDRRQEDRASDWLMAMTDDDRLLLACDLARAHRIGGSLAAKVIMCRWRRRAVRRLEESVPKDSKVLQ
ncbi:MAG: hypothetical protein ACK5MR_10085, partial [Cumulibacter sp.]